MYFMDCGLNMKWLVVVFVIVIVVSLFGMGNLLQSNGIVISIEVMFGFEFWIVGSVLGILLVLVILGGIQCIVVVIVCIVFIMVVVYLIGVLVVIFVNIENIGLLFVVVISDVFIGFVVVGGFFGVLLVYVFNCGVNCGLFFNEVGQGFVFIVYVVVKIKEFVFEGMVFLFEFFIDIIIICIIMGLVIFFLGVWKEKYENVFDCLDMIFVVGEYLDKVDDDKVQLYGFLNSMGDSDVKFYMGLIFVVNGMVVILGYILINVCLIVEDV